MGRILGSLVAVVLAVLVWAFATDRIPVVGGDQVDLLSSTRDATPAMITGLKVIREACPALGGNASRYVVHAAQEGKASLSAEREFGVLQAVSFNVEITDAAGRAGDAGNHCSFEVAQGSDAGVIVSKTACVRLCTGDDDPPASYVVQRI